MHLRKLRTFANIIRECRIRTLKIMDFDIRMTTLYQGTPVPGSLLRLGWGLLEALVRKKTSCCRFTSMFVSKQKNTTSFSFVTTRAREFSICSAKESRSRSLCLDDDPSKSWGFLCTFRSLGTCTGNGEGGWAGVHTTGIKWIFMLREAQKRARHRVVI